jgi:chitin disaccharide deacetylase
VIQLIVNADDFGYSKAINYGIIDCHKEGIVNSATMMMNSAGTQHAIKLAKENPSLRVGIHLVLTSGSPLLNNVPSLVDHNGNFKKQSHLLKYKDIHLDELEREWSAQIEAFLSSGLIPTHFDSHHHVHGIKEFYPVVKRLSERYQLPVRNVNNKRNDKSFLSDLFFADFYGETATQDYFTILADRVKDGQSIEVMCHPGYLDHHVMEGSSYNLARLKETAILTSVELPKNMILI